MKKIAITGGMATGKSSVCRIFQELGAYVLDSDEIVHQLLSLNPIVKNRVIELLGNKVLVNNIIDRKKVAQEVFDHLDKLKKLEDIIHPFVYKEIEKRYIKEKNNYKLFVVEVPLLFETHHEKDFDIVITVEADENICKKRWNNKHLNNYEKRINRHWSQKQKTKNATFVINNNKTIEELKKEVKKLTEVFLTSN